MNFDKLVQRLLDTRREPSRVRMGTIPDDHSSGNPRVIGDGETEPSGMGYPIVQAYSAEAPPAAGDRVMMQRQGKNWVVAGKVVDLDAP